MTSHCVVLMFLTLCRWDHRQHPRGREDRRGIPVNEKNLLILVLYSNGSLFCPSAYTPLSSVSTWGHSFPATPSCSTRAHTGFEVLCVCCQFFSLVGDHCPLLVLHVTNTIVEGKSELMSCCCYCWIQLNQSTIQFRIGSSNRTNYCSTKIFLIPYYSELQLHINSITQIQQ